jgi:hypothetical protein
MQITSLNKVLNLFMVGLFVIILFAYSMMDRIISHLSSDKFKNLSDAVSEPVLVLAITLMLFSVALLAGLIIESALSIFKTFLKPSHKHTFVVSFLRCKRQVRQTEDIRAEFEKIFTTSRKYKHFASKERSNTIATAIFFHTANPQNIEWLTQHYSLYMLSASYAFLLFLGLIIYTAGPAGLLSKVIFLCCDLAVIYLLLHTAVNKYFFAHAIVNRHACIVVNEAIEASLENTPKL